MKMEKENNLTLTLTKKKKRQKINAYQDVEKSEQLYTVVDNINWYSKLVWKTVRRFLKKLKTELPYDPVTLLLDIHPKETKLLSQVDNCSPIITVALFTILKVWKQPKWLNRWMDQNIWYMHKTESY